MLREQKYIAQVVLWSLINEVRKECPVHEYWKKARISELSAFNLWLPWNQTS